MSPRVSAPRAVILALMTLLLPRDASPGTVEASSVAADDACFYDVASGRCVASAVWVTGQHGLLRTPRANLLADVAAGIETCASAFGDEEACAHHVGTCDYDATFIPNENAGFESVGGCFPTLSWAAALAERCLADVSDADATVSALLATAVACVAHTRTDPTDRARECAADARCEWTEETETDGAVAPGYCAPDPLRAAVGALGASGVGALAAAKTACEEIRLETPCDSDPKCEWRAGAGRCAANAARALRGAVTSPALKAYLGRVERCAAGRAGAAACAAADPAGKTCAWGKMRSSTNIIPEAYDGDGGDGSGGWVSGDASRDSGDSETGPDMSCFPTYASIANAVAPTLDVAAGACGSLAPLFDAAEACAAAGSDRDACRAVGSCSYASASPSGDAVDDGQCEMDASAAMEALVSGGDAAVFRAMRAACAAGDGNETVCEGSGADAAAAGIEAAGGERRAGFASNVGGAPGETTALAHFVIFCFFFFAFAVAPPVAYANRLKNRGEDVRDLLPPWARPYVPVALTPQTARYEAFVGQETAGDDS